MPNDRDISATEVGDFRFDVFLCHASEDKDEVLAFARGLEAAELRVWLDEERMSPGGMTLDAIGKGLKQSRHALIWVTDAWLNKSWTRWELSLFAEVLENHERRVVPVLRVPWDSSVLGPYLTERTAILPERDENERLWLAVCGLTDRAPGKRETWARQGQALAQGVPIRRQVSQHDQPPPGSIAARLDAAYERRDDLKVLGQDTSEINALILELRREQRHGPTLHSGEFLGNGRFRLKEIIGQGGFATAPAARGKANKLLPGAEPGDKGAVWQVTWRESRRGRRPPSAAAHSLGVSGSARRSVQLLSAPLPGRRHPIRGDRTVER